MVLSLGGGHGLQGAPVGIGSPSPAITCCASNLSPGRAHYEDDLWSMSNPKSVSIACLF
jgi:hypothetical protein